ncbi:MAG: magnesium chelatase [Bryobacterales bacterium]|nr:magnesium chelatase [Bryobacterales bacterium]
MRPDLPHTLGALRRSEFSEAKLGRRTVKDELRSNLMARLKAGGELFPGIVGYEDSVVPQIVNAVLSRHNFILLGLRGQAKTRLVRMLTTLLDEAIPYVAGTETRDNPYHPLSRQAKLAIAEMGDDTPIDWLTREQRYVEKLATPDVTIADMIGDIDPIKAARHGHNISDELTMHYGLLPRANRGIFAINELPDLAGKIQVGLFNIMQEGDVQIKGYPVRLALDVMLVFTANPEDYTARGKIITPLKDRIGSEIRTHYPATLEHGMAITQQEAWTRRDKTVDVTIPAFLREVVESIAFLARDDKKIDKRSGVSQRLPITVLENAVSNAERRALKAGEDETAARIVDIFAAMPSMTGKIELEYEGELKGGDAVARELIRGAVGRVFTNYYDGVDFKNIIKWFDLGGSLQLDEALPAKKLIKELDAIGGLMEKTAAVGIGPGASNAERAAAAEFILEGLYAHRRISRSEDRIFTADAKRREEPRPREEQRDEQRRRSKRDFQ